MQFRKDINSLRALAVIAVVLFHFNESWMPGGFAGVDVFFVISGFLMTGIIFRGIEQESFSILKFYVARANRIIPALAALCFVLLIFGWLYLTPVDYKTLGKYVGSSMGFLSNFIYWRESGYFDAVSHEKWLLHTWSLSVEWQFYIIYPLVLVAMRKVISIKAMKTAILFGTVFGFIFCVVATYKWPNTSYYLLPTRAWQMLFGGVAYLYPFSLDDKKKKLLELSGLILIIASYIFISKNTPWPGVLALIPVTGVFFIIQAERNDSIIARNIILQNLGKWSYSIYLWHWPLVVAIYFYSLSVEYVYTGIFLSIILGFLSNKYIEGIRFRNDFTNLWSYLSCKPFIITIIIGVVSCILFQFNGLNFRVSDELQIKNKKAINAIRDWNYPEPNLIIDNHEVRFIKGDTEKNILFIGASHIEQTYPYVEDLALKYNVYYLTEGGCFVSKSFKNPKKSCENIQNYKDFIEKIKFEKIVTSIFFIDGFLSENNQIKNNQIKSRISDYNDFLFFAKSHSKEVFLILTEPQGPEFDPKLSVRHSLNNFITLEEARKRNKIHYDVYNTLTQLDGVKVIDPIDYLCEERCMVMDNNGNYFYKDEHHMRTWYAKKSLGYLEPIFN